MSGHHGNTPTFVHQGRTIVSMPGMHEMAAEIKRFLWEEHHNDMVHIRAPQKVFANDESLPDLAETVRGEYVFLLAGMQHPHPDIAFMQMMRTMQALHLASVKGITTVVPYFSYARQDRKAKAREPISARLNADMMQCVPALERVITSELHAAQVQGFFRIPVDDLSGIKIQARHIRKHFNNELSNVTVVTPDIGGGKRAEKMAKELGVPIAIIDKRRKDDSEAESFAIIGDVAGRDCIIIDDMCDGGGTLRNAVSDLLAHGAKSALPLVMHALLSGKAIEKFREAHIKLVATQTIPRDEGFRASHQDWLTFIPIEAMFASAIHEASLVGGSISRLAA